MSLSSPFIRRPVATTLLTIGVFISGAIGFTKLPVSAGCRKSIFRRFRCRHSFPARAPIQ